MKKSKFVLFVCLLFATSTGFSQDTIWNVKKVLIVKQQLSRKTDKPIRSWYRKMTVKSGYIIKMPDGRFLINGKTMIPDNYSYMDDKFIVRRTNK